MLMFLVGIITLIAIFSVDGLPQALLVLIGIILGIIILAGGVLIAAEYWVPFAEWSDNAWGVVGLVVAVFAMGFFSD